MIGAALIALTVGLLLIWRKKMPKTTVLLMLLAGSGLTAGWIGRTVDRLVDWSAAGVSKVTQSAAGEAVPALVAIPVLFVVVHDLWPRNSATKWTALAAFFLPVVAALIPGPVGDATRTVIGGMAGLSADAVNSAVQGG